MTMWRCKHGEDNTAGPCNLCMIEYLEAENRADILIPFRHERRKLQDEISSLEKKVKAVREEGIAKWTGKEIQYRRLLLKQARRIQNLNAKLAACNRRSR